MFHNAQHGFLEGRSTTTQLPAFYHETGLSLAKGLQSDIVYLDLAKVFDSVSHQRLLLKLSRYGVSGKLLQWFESYLGGRGQQCLVHGFTRVVLQFHRESLRAVSSVLLPVIQNRIALFADDSKFSSVIESQQDYESLQKDLDSLHGWTDNWHPSHVSATYFRYDYKLNNSSLKHVTQVKDFGVTISSDLTWYTHINTILAKANRMLAFLRNDSVMLFTTDQRKLLYLTFVRSYIGYASEVWAPSMGS